MDYLKFKIQSFFTLVFFFLIFSSCAQTKVPTITKVNGEKVEVEKLNAYVKHLMDSLEMPALSLAIINDAEIVYHNNFGVMNSETKEKIDENSIFEGASLSKPIFAYFAMKMAQKGILDLDKPLYQYLPHPGISDSSSEDYKLINARMILSHSSGFPNFSEGQQIKLPFKPGHGFQYSGEGYQYLAAIIGQLNGVGWKEKLNAIFENEVTQPLGMIHTSFLWNEYLAKNKVYGHYEGKPTDNSTGEWSGKTFNAFSSVHSNAYEYAKFIVEMIKQEGLEKELFDQMLQTQNNFSDSNEIYQETGQTGWGLGFAQKPTPYGLMHLHTGNNHDFQAYCMFVPKQKYGLVLFTNSDKMQTFIEQLGNLLENQF